MAHDMFELLRKEEVEWSSQTAKPSEDGSRELCFLEQVITPVYQIVAVVSFGFTFLIMHCSSRMLFLTCLCSSSTCSASFLSVLHVGLTAV